MKVSDAVTSVLHLTQVCVADLKKENAVVTLQVIYKNQKPLTICVLKVGQTNHVNVSLYVDPELVQFKTVGENVPVHLTGYYEPERAESDSENEDVENIEKTSNMVPVMGEEEEEEEELDEEDKELVRKIQAQMKSAENEKTPVKETKKESVKTPETACKTDDELEEEDIQEEHREQPSKAESEAQVKQIQNSLKEQSPVTAESDLEEELEEEDMEDIDEIPTIKEDSKKVIEEKESDLEDGSEEEEFSDMSEGTFAALTEEAKRRGLITDEDINRPPKKQKKSL